MPPRRGRPAISASTAAVFPAFSDAKTIQRFRGFGSLNGRGDRKRELIAEVDHVAWLLGVNFTIQVVPAAGDGVLHVLAGQSESVRQRGRRTVSRGLELARSRSGQPGRGRHRRRRRPTDLGKRGPGVASGRTFRRGGRRDRRLLRFGRRPGPALRRMAHAPSRESALRHIGKERPVDALPAAQLAHALEQHKVYLLSRLDPSVVEELEMIPIAGPDELARLARQHRIVHPPFQRPVCNGRNSSGRW